MDVEFRDSPVEELPFADSTFDTVVATLVLCTVRGQERSFGEIRRVLRPGGEFRFIEHVRAKAVFTRWRKTYLRRFGVWSQATAARIDEPIGQSRRPASISDGWIGSGSR